MSLIHSALKQMDAQPTLAISPRAAASEQKLSLAKNIALAFAGLTATLAIAAVIWFVLERSKTPVTPKLADAPQPVAVQKSDAKQAAVALAENTNTAQTAASASASEASPPASGKLDARVLSTSANLPMPADQGKVAVQTSASFQPAAPFTKPSVPMNSTVPVSKAKPVVAAESVAPELSVDKRLALFLQADSSNDMPGALEQLKAVQQQTQPGNVSRVRAEAWYALRTGDTVGAKRSYADILDRLPDDEEASINLASLEARDGRGEAARQLLSTALRSHPDSEALRDALKRFKASAGN